MAEIDHNSVHLKISSLEAMQSKGKILEAEVNMLHLLENLQKFKELRRKESVEKGKAVKIMHEINKDIEDILEMIPKREESARDSGAKISAKANRKEIKKTSGKKIDIKEEDEISLKLREIRKRLGQLKES